MIYSRYLSNSVKPSAPRPLYSRLHVFFTSLYPNRKVNDFKIDLYSHSTFEENVLECSRRMHPDVRGCKFYFLIHEKTYFFLTGSRISRSNITATQNRSVNDSVLGTKMWSVFCSVHGSDQDQNPNKKSGPKIMTRKMDQKLGPEIWTTTRASIVGRAKRRPVNLTTKQSSELNSVGPETPKSMNFFSFGPLPVMTSSALIRLQRPLPPSGDAVSKNENRTL